MDTNTGENYYDDEMESDDSESEGEKSEPNLALLPKNFFPNKVGIGSTCSIRVEEIREDQVLVSYAKAKAPKVDREISELMS